MCYFIDEDKSEPVRAAGYRKITEQGDIKMEIAYVVASMVISAVFDATLIAKDHSYHR